AIAILVERRRAWWQVVAGGAPFAVLLFAYQMICFGGPFRTAVDATTDNFKSEGAFLGVFEWPHAASAFAILFSRYRGLFFLSPVLIFAFAGALVMWRRRVALRELAIVAGVFAAFVIVNASFNGWHGGSAIGPRYILPVVPFLAVPMMYAID